MGICMTSVFQWSMSRLLRRAVCGLPYPARAAGVGLIMALLSWSAAAQQLPDGAGKAETVKLCSQCHELERSVSMRQDRAGWQETIDKMVSLGAQGTAKEFSAVLDYLSTNYAGEALPKLNVNKAAAIDFESRLSLKRSEAAAIIAYRTKNGPFQSIDDLKKVPGIDTAKIEAKKSQLSFKTDN